MNFNLVEMYNGLLRFNKHILNELAEGLKHLPNLDGVSKGDSLIINEQGNPSWGSTAFIPTFENAAYGIEWTKDNNDIICVKDTGTKYQLWISDFNIDGTFTRVHPFIISHTKTMTRTREDGKAYYADSRDKTLFYSIHRFNHFPINFKIIKYDWRIYAKNRKEKVKLKT